MPRSEEKLKRNKTNKEKKKEKNSRRPKEVPVKASPERLRKLETQEEKFPKNSLEMLTKEWPKLQDKTSIKKINGKKKT